MKSPLPFKLDVIQDTEPYLYTQDGSLPWVVGTRDDRGFDGLAAFPDEATARKHADQIKAILERAWEVVSPDPYAMAFAINESLLITPPNEAAFQP